MFMLKLQRHTKHQESSNTKTKSSANSEKQDLLLRNQVYQGRLLASFQDDAKYEHGGQDTRSQGKNDTVWNEKASNVFRKEREQYVEIQDLKAQLQDKNIAISELKKLIKKGKGKSVDTKFYRQPVVRQPNAQRILKPLVLGKPTPFLNSLERIYFSKTKSVPKANVSEGLSKPVTAQTLSQTARQADSLYTSVNDRYADGMHAVPPPMTGNYMPSGPDVEIDYSKFTYGPKQASVDESDSKPSEYASCESDSSIETNTSMPEPVETALKVVCEPKVWTDAPIIEGYESDSDNDSVSNVQEDIEKPSFAFTDYVKHVKTSRENVKETCTPNHSPKVEKQDRNGNTRKGLGYAFTRKACFVVALAAIKKVNDVVKLRALVDGKWVVVTEDFIRQALHLGDADGVECSPNEEIFTELARIVRRGLRGTNSVVQWHLLSSVLLQVEISTSLTKMEEDDVEVPAAPTLPSPLNAPSPPPQDPITTPPQAQLAPLSPPPHEQPTETSASSMTLLNTLVETCATLSQKVAQLEQDKISQAMEILKLKKRVKKLENKKRSKSSGCIQTWGKIEATYADEDITLVDAKTQVDMDAELQGRIDDVGVAATNEVNAVEPIVFDDEEENIDWNVVAEQIQKKHLVNIRKYRSLKRKLVSIAQARKNMIIYLKNMAGYKMEHFRGAESTQDTPTNDPKEISEEDVQNMLEIVSVSEFKVEALQVKYPLIDWEIHSEGSRSYWKIIRVGGITEAYQSFKDMLKGFDREDLDALWRLVKEKFSSAVPSVDMEKALWVKVKRLFEPDANDVLWKLQRYMLLEIRK
nr:hypothetical protein [Tanacetum cinerariifolium]